jgi:GH15 family glucan-1,4-alpha-glucosidase
VVLRAPIELSVHPDSTSASFEVEAGKRLAFVLSYGAAHEPTPEPIDAEATLIETQNFWRSWIGGFNNAKTAWPTQVRRSLITLMAMIHTPTGGLVAVPTTSLPEVPGGAMNWTTGIAGCATRASRYAPC